MPELLNNETFKVHPVIQGTQRALLINPPVYDAQYWARWSQPAGLLRIASFLKKNGYLVELIDCMETDKRGYVRKSRHRNEDNSFKEVVRGDIKKLIWHFGLGWDAIRARMAEMEPPDEIWITSIMTYWWESTRDMVQLAREMFPKATILVGGIYPTLAPDHAMERLTDANIIFTGELVEANNEWTDLSLYKLSPTYAILTTSRGCPWDCHYCAARTLNNGSKKMRARDPEDVLKEIKDKKEKYGIKQFGFYEDNALALRGHMQEILELVIKQKHKLHLYAPEGFETRMLNEDLLKLMKQAGFQKIHLPFEALKWDTNLGWNRRHASTASFDLAFEAAIKAGFKPRTAEINAFVLFGLPDEKLEDILDSVLYVHHTVGSIIPMLFTPVPGTQIYREHRDYLHEEMGWDLQDLNGKILPFLEYNQRNYLNLKASEYFALEALMSILNDGKLLARAVDICSNGTVPSIFRDTIKVNN